MPFTFAHPIVVIPLKKTKLNWSLTALVIGSMVPDFEFLIQMREVEIIGHHWYGVMIFDFPVALFLCYLFHNLLKNSILENLPSYYRKKLIHFQDFNWNEYARKNIRMVFLSLLVGILSHLCLDAFTHHDGFIVELFPFLSNNIQIGEYATPIYFLLQLSYSIIGLALVHNMLLQLPPYIGTKPKNEKTSQSWHYWIYATMLFTLILTMRLVALPESNTFEGVIIAIVGSSLYSWLLVSIIFHFKFHKQKEPKKCKQQITH